jgi:DNA-binding winged helix-turn-helix (wHTH) protein
MKNRHYILLVLLAAVLTLTAITFIDQNKAKVSEKHLIVVLRNIGHRLLLHGHDSTSRVLPIKKINQNTYQLEFQSQFTFVSDSLVKLVHQNLQSGHLPTEYIVSVLDCANKEVLFGYEINAKTDNTILPCLGRTQPTACYIIQIEFLKSTFSYFYFLFALPLILAGFFLSKGFQKKRIATDITDNEPFVKIGRLCFYAQKQLLRFNSTTVELSDKESKLLTIFADNPNQLVERERCLQELWKNDGVIVIDRSLDVLVSKLRKKLQVDDSIKIINIHGKGYKLLQNDHSLPVFLS